MRFVLLVLLAALPLSIRAASVTISADPQSCDGLASPITVGLEQYALLKPTIPKKCMESITFSGEITHASASDLIKALELADGSAIVGLDSPGGDLWEALRVARLVRSRGYAYVAWGVFENMSCMSSCVVLLAGGIQRAGAYGRVGIHRPYFTQAEASSRGYASMKLAYDALFRELVTFFRETNIDPRLADEMWRTPSHKVRVLTSDEVDSFGLSDHDAVFTEMGNANIRDVCGNDGPTAFAAFMEDVVLPCNDASVSSTSTCWEDRGAKAHPGCRCFQKIQGRDPDTSCQ